MDWIGIEPPSCGFSGYCESPGLTLAPGEEARHAVDLGPGYYALVCARKIFARGTEPARLAADGRCRPARFTVGVGTTGPRGRATPAGWVRARRLSGDGGRHPRPVEADRRSDPAE